MGASLDAWDVLLTAMTKKGYTKSELLDAGLVVQNKNGGLYDKFRNRLMLPVIDTRGDVVAFGSRVLDKSEPKYMNSSETPVYSKRRVLYGLNLAKKSKRPNIILCEGNLDIVTLHQAGFDNAVASMGTALTVEQTRLLSRFTKELVLCYDNDNAGKIATERALQILNGSEFSVKVLQLPRRLVDGEYIKQDADDFIKFQGPDAFERLLNGSENGVEFRMAQIAGKYDLKDDEARIAYCGEVSELLARVEALCRRVSRSTGGEEKGEKGGSLGMLTSGDFVLDENRRVLLKAGQPIELTQVEFQIMELFFRNPGIALVREKILKGVWGENYFGDVKIVDVNIRRLRMKVEDEPSHPAHILTVWGYGYRWEE